MIPSVGPDIKAWAESIRRYLASVRSTLEFKSADAKATQDGIILWDATNGYPVVSKSGVFEQISLGAGSGGAAWGAITGTLADQTDLQTALNGKAAASHSHAISDVTGLQTALDAKPALGVMIAMASKSYLM